MCSCACSRCGSCDRWSYGPAARYGSCGRSSVPTGPRNSKGRWRATGSGLRGPRTPRTCCRSLRSRRSQRCGVSSRWRLDRTGPEADGDDILRDSVEPNRVYGWPCGRTEAANCRTQAMAPGLFVLARRALGHAVPRCPVPVRLPVVTVGWDTAKRAVSRAVPVDFGGTGTGEMGGIRHPSRSHPSVRRPHDRRFDATSRRPGSARSSPEPRTGRHAEHSDRDRLVLT